MRKQANNTRITDPQFVDRKQELAAMELLPRQLRDALREATIPINAIEVAQEWHSRVGKCRRPELLRDFLTHVAVIEARDIADFGKRFRRDHGGAYPHLAAGATIQRGGYE